MIIGYYNNCLKDIVLIVIYYLLYNSGIACSKTIFPLLYNYLIIEG